MCNRNQSDSDALSVDQSDSGVLSIDQSDSVIPSIGNRIVAISMRYVTKSCIARFCLKFLHRFFQKAGRGVGTASPRFYQDKTESEDIL